MTAAVYYLALGMVYLGWRIEKKRKMFSRMTSEDRKQLFIVVPVLVLFWPVALAVWAALKIERMPK